MIIGDTDSAMTSFEKDRQFYMHTAVKAKQGRQFLGVTGLLRLARLDGFSSVWLPVFLSFNAMFQFIGG
jgi:hypothetical protein